MHRIATIAVLSALSCAPASPRAPLSADEPAQPTPARDDHAPELQADDTAQGPGTANRIADGQTRLTVYEGFMSPAQEPGEDSEAPRLPGAGLAATAPATARTERKSRGFGQLRFTRDLSRAFVDVYIEGVRAEDIVMFHVHCGPPGVLGPIIVDLGALVDLRQALADGHMSAEIANDDVTFVKHAPKGLKPRLPEGCPVDKGFLNQVKTVAGLEFLARQGVLYFNLHTKAHTFYGEMRGQIYAAD